MKVLLLLGFASLTLGQTQTLWGQCGGIGWTGPKTCAAPACCVYGNDWYSQCLNSPCSATSASTTRSVTSSSTTSRISTTSFTTISTPRPTSSTVNPTSSKTTSSVTSSVTTASLSTVSRTTTSTAAAASFTNPIIYQDLPDNDVSLGPDGYFYLSASNFHFSPGAPIYRSKDLENWEAYGHSIPTLDFGDSYSLIGGQAYRRGTWASSLRYRKSNKTWYWIGCIDFYNSFIYTASSPAGPWTRSASLWGRCYYDCGLFIDDDDTMYVVHGSNNVNVTQLDAAGLAEVKTAPMASNPAGFDGMEGNRLYKRNGTYYILNDSGSGQITWIWRSTSPWGPWEMQVLQQYSGVVAPPTGGTPHQGSLIQTPLGDWYFVSFSWTFPLGRIPVIAPITWGSDGWPVLGLVVGKWNLTYPNPLPQVETPSWTGTDLFTGTSLGQRWEWNHNPDTTKFSVNNGVTLSTATVTSDFYLARNTLTHRPLGPNPVATVVIDTTNLADGDRAGLSALGILSAYIGVVRNGNSYTIVNRQSMQLSTSDWSTTNTGTDVASASIAKGKVWLRGSADPLGTKNVSFQYSTDGTTFKSLGTAYTLSGDYSLFMGFRWGIFNFATKALGGSVKLISYTQ